MYDRWLLFSLLFLHKFLTIQTQEVCGSNGRCSSPNYNFNHNTCGAWLGFRNLGSSEDGERDDILFTMPKLIHQAFLYDNNWNYGSNPPSIPNSITANSAYYCFQDDTSDNVCKVGLTGDPVGRVCADEPANLARYQFTTDPSQMTSNQCTYFAINPLDTAIWCDVLWQAEQYISSTWNQCQNQNASDYNLLEHNCQDYVAAVLNAYCCHYGGCPGCPCNQAKLPEAARNKIRRITDRTWINKIGRK